MTDNWIISLSEQVQKLMIEYDPSHDWNHIQRVVKLTSYLADREKLSDSQQRLAQISAILHDIGDWKYGGQVSLVKDILETYSNHLSSEDMACIYQIVKTLGFSHELEDNCQLVDFPIVGGQEIFNVVQDADRLDAMGALGIARCLTYGAVKQQILYDPNIPPRLNLSSQDYYNYPPTTINHFDEKLLKLKTLMKTGTGYELAIKRHDIMTQFVRSFIDEWNGHDFKI